MLFLLVWALVQPLCVEAGVGKYGKEIVETIDTMGAVCLDETFVKKLHVLGSLNAEKAHIEDLEVQGSVSISYTQITKSAEITGYLAAHHSYFDGPLSLTIQKAIFTATHVTAVTVHENLGFKGKQLLELKEKTVIDGPVVFEGGQGEIHLYSGSKVLGPVSGGKIIRK